MLMVPRAGRYPHAEYPELVNPAITAFIQKTAPGTATRFRGA
jgi:hypothetical protein